MDECKHLKGQHATQALSLMEQVKSFVDLIKLHLVRDVFVELGAAIHILGDELRDGDARFVPTKSRSLPRASGHELERTRGDFRTSGGDTNDDGSTPAL